MSVSFEETVGSKFCSRCQSTKPRDEFYMVNRDGKPSITSYCKICIRKQSNDRRINGPSLCPNLTPNTVPIIDGRRRCARCKQNVLVADFRRKGTSFGYCFMCETEKSAETRAKPEQKLKSKERGRKHHLRTKFSMQEEDYDSLLSIQNGVCAVCGSLPGSHKFHIDHNHNTGKVRGLLCSQCNLGLGGFKDSVGLLVSAVAYLGLK